MKRKIILSGELGKKFGHIHWLAVNTAAEAVRAFCANFPDFERFVIDSEKRNVGYKVFLSKDPIQSAEELHYPCSTAIRIVPVIAGSKSGFGQILIGAALIGAAFIPGANVAIFAGMSATYSSVAFGLGVSMILGGVSQLLAPQVKAASPSERPENKPSYVFDGPVNTTAQGQAVPVGYGRLIIGSAVISVGISSDNYV